MARSEGEEESQARLGSDDQSLACAACLYGGGALKSEQLNRADHQLG
jgi:hypothetical protein